MIEARAPSKRYGEKRALPPWVGLGVMVAWTAAATVTAGFVLVRSDA